MTKQDAINYFGSMTAIARELDCTYQAIQGWPDELTRRIQDRVELAMIKDKAKKDALVNI